MDEITPNMNASYDMSRRPEGTAKSAPKTWFYFTEIELTPGAARVGPDQAASTGRWNPGTKTGGLAWT